MEMPTATPGTTSSATRTSWINFDATADANARLAYGVDGGQAGQTACTPGTGGNAGTANGGTTNTGVPCVLNPTIVLRAGTSAGAAAQRLGRWLQGPGPGHRGREQHAAPTR